MRINKNKDLNKLLELGFKKKFNEDTGLLEKYVFTYGFETVYEYNNITVTINKDFEISINIDSMNGSLNQQSSQQLIDLMEKLVKEDMTEV